MYLAMSSRSYFIVRIFGLYVVGKLRGVSIQIMRRFAVIEMPNPGAITNIEFIHKLVSFPETYVACVATSNSVTNARP